MITLQQFVAKNQGERLDFDGKYKNQCVDLYRFYVQDVWGLPQTPGVPGAYKIMDTLPNTYQKYYSGIPQAGDVICWDQNYVKNGHVAVVTEADSKTFKAFQQNAPLPLDAANIGTFTYKHVIGWFRPQLKTTFMKVTVVANNIKWDYKSQLPIISDWFKTFSKGKLEVVFDSVDVNLGKPPLQDFNGKKCVDINWYREHVTPLGTGEVTTFLMNPEDYPNEIWGFMTYGDDGKPCRTEVSSYPDPNFKNPELVVHRIFHELCHALYFFTGQPDRVHELLLVTPDKYDANRYTLLGEIDYAKLQAKLVTIKPMAQNQTIPVIAKDGKTIYLATPIAMDWENFKKQASVEGITITEPIRKASDL